MGQAPGGWESSGGIGRDVNQLTRKSVNREGWWAMLGEMVIIFVVGCILNVLGFANFTVTLAVALLGPPLCHLYDRGRW